MNSDFKRKRRELSRDEMNLAEFPLTVLSTRVNPKIKTLEFRDTVKTKDGKETNREWIITGADKFGLPTSSDDEVLLGLLKLTIDQGIKKRKVFFTRYELLKILEWSTEGRNYTRLQRALDRLSGVRIKATNAFFDNSSKTHSTVNFGIIDGYEIHDGRDSKDKEPKPSFFVWSDVLFKSFQVGYIKKLNLSFYLSLNSAVSKRLYRFLDKHFWYKSIVRINIFVLAHEKLGISRNYRYVSSLRQQLDGAFDELIKRGFLSSYSYEGTGGATDVVLYSAVKKGRKFAEKSIPGQAVEAKPPERGVEGESLLSGQFKTLKRHLSENLVKRGIDCKQAERLLLNRSLPELKRMCRIIDQFDYLVATRSKYVSLSPVGFLYRAVENPDKFCLPGETKQAGAGAQETLKLSRCPGKNLKKKRGRDQEELRSQYLIERKLEIKRLKENVEPKLLGRIRSEVEEALGKLEGLISGARFKEAVELGVEEKLASLFAYPDYSEWLQKQN